MIIIDFIVCDDIRFEQQGKRSLMGVYEEVFPIFDPQGSDVWPKLISFGISVRSILTIEDIQKKPTKVELFLKIDNKKVSLTKGPLPTSPVTDQGERRISMTAVFNGYPIEKAGKLSVILAAMDANDTVIAEAESPGSLSFKVFSQPNINV